MEEEYGWRAGKMKEALSILPFHSMLEGKMRKKIMVVDDEEDILSLIREILEGEGYGVICVNNGEEAVIKAVELQPDLILLDIMMPGMDGWEVVKLLKEHESTKDIPVAFLTCKGELRDKIMALQEGACHYITKPFTPQRLVEEVKMIFERTGGEGDK
ncbi:hypothetical protein DRQ18_01235 [bacterium]|nr:MAG: hypothetical protein DRQ18_01235 [bacterium]